MKRNRNGYRSPVATGLALVFAIVAAALLLAGLTIDGGTHGAALVQPLVVTTVVIGLACVGALSGTGDDSTIPDRSGLPARAQEVLS
jgi:hypothetical protein